MTPSPSEPTKTRRRHRHLRITAALAGIAAIFPLSGCFDAQAGFTISGDDRVSGTVHVTPEEGFRSQFEQWKAPEDLSDRVSQEVIDSSTGKIEVAFNELHFIELTDTLRQLSDDRIDIDLDRTGGGKISMNGHMDLTHLPGAKVDFVVTFPEQVTDSNGRQTEPNKVEWQLASGENHTVWASSPTGSTKRNQFLLFAGVTTAAGVLASALGILWARRVRDMQDF
ncbi:LppM family (lipo)protein [Corynebacterium vitaeruminis]|uniref:LppM family (lipo)protein n=1 Tax=Corynebacterium vitaeruminis TaxID=38305 RepID=UPI00066026D4|nr:DUF3153 domain-containing protein [Corynebacterium vitaeruminis]